MVVLQRAGDDLAGRGRALVDEDDQRHLLHRVRQAPQRIGAATTLVVLGRRLERRLRIGKLAVGRDDDRVGRQERRRDRDRALEQAARVVAQVEDEALQVRVLLVQVLQLVDEILDGAILELADTQPRVARLDHLGADALGADLLADDVDREGAPLALAEDGQHDLGVRLAAHALDGLVDRQALDQRVVDLGDEVAALQAGAKRGRAFDRADDLDQAVFHAHLDADADEAAGRGLAEFLEGLLVEVLRMRVEAGDHAADRVADELLLVDRLDVVALDHAEDRRELLKLFDGQAGHRVARCRLELHGRQRTGDGAECEPARDLEFHAHERTLRFPIAATRSCVSATVDLDTQYIPRSNFGARPPGKVARRQAIFKVRGRSCRGRVLRLQQATSEPWVPRSPGPWAGRHVHCSLALSRRRAHPRSRGLRHLVTGLTSRAGQFCTPRPGRPCSSPLHSAGSIQPLRIHVPRVRPSMTTSVLPARFDPRRRPLGLVAMAFAAAATLLVGCGEEKGEGRDPDGGQGEQGRDHRPPDQLRARPAARPCRRSRRPRRAAPCSSA